MMHWVKLIGVAVAVYVVLAYIGRNAAANSAGAMFKSA